MKGKRYICIYEMVEKNSDGDIVDTTMFARLQDATETMKKMAKENPF